MLDSASCASLDFAEFELLYQLRFWWVDGRMDGLTAFMLSSGWVDGWIKIWMDRLTAFCVLILGQILNRLYENCPKIRFFFQSRWILPNTQAKGCTNTKQRFDILVFSIRRCLLLIHGCRGTPKRKNIQTTKKMYFFHFCELLSPNLLLMSFEKKLCLCKLSILFGLLAHFITKLTPF